MLLDAGADGEDVGIEDEVLGGEADLFGEDLVGPLGDGHAVVDAGRFAYAWYVREVEGRLVPIASSGGRVLIMGRDGVLEERKVRTGIANWEYTEVLEGLQPGEKVVTSLEKEGVKAGIKARLAESADDKK